MTIKHGQVPLTLEDNGTIRIASTRVTLDTVISAFRNGSSCEEIVEQYPVLALGDVYWAIGFYLKNRKFMEEYLQNGKTKADEARNKIEALFPRHGVRESLLKNMQNS